MKILSISGLTNQNHVSKNNTYQSFSSSKNQKDMKGLNNDILKVLDDNNLITIENISDKKVGSKFLIKFNDPKYEGFTLLFKPDSVFSSEKYPLSLDIKKMTMLRSKEKSMEASDNMMMEQQMKI